MFLQDSAWRIVVGFLVSVLGGHVALWLVIQKCLWPYAGKRHKYDPTEKRSHLAWVVGIVERFLYTGALLLPGGGPELIAGFLAIKVATRWQSSQGKDEKPDSGNIWLIGTVVSLMFGFLGALIALGQLPPSFTAKPQ